MKEEKKRGLSTTQVVAMGFFTAILIGTVILMLPVCSADGEVTGFVDALFTATTSVCVTGLVVVDTFSHWSTIGHVVILILIQCGGLGIITLTMAVMVIIGKKVTLKDRMVLQDAFNLNTLGGLVKFLKKIIKGTFVVEGIGALCYMFVFVPQYGLRGIWISVFTAVSAFCNAGIDLIGSTSLTPYVGNVWLNLVTMLLIIIGGIGFIVWWDVIDVVRRIKNGEIHIRNFFKKLTLHSHIVIVATLGLIIGGAVIIFMMEYTNPETIGNMSFGQKILASFFQSVTTRTAGFFTISQKGLRDTTAFFCLILMFIGGSPVGTAGGIKTTTVALLLIVAYSVARGYETTSIFKRRIPEKTIKKALAVVMVSMFILFVMICLVSITNNGEFMDVAYETTSAIATVGLTRNFTGTLNMAGKLIITFCMYLGRIGPISLVILFNFKNSSKSMLIYSEEDITVG